MTPNSLTPLLHYISLSAILFLLLLRSCQYVTASKARAATLPRPNRDSSWVVSLYGSYIYLQSAKYNPDNPGNPIPEARLYFSIIGSFFGITGGMFVYAWTSYPTLPWIAPAIGLGMVGFGIQIVISAVADYLTDAYAASGYAGSAISAIAFGENIVAGILPLAAQSMYGTLGFQWASSLLGFVALLLSVAPVILLWKGEYFREKSPFIRTGGGKLSRA